jgi:hypothetical protein
MLVVVVIAFLFVLMWRMEFGITHAPTVQEGQNALEQAKQLRTQINAQSAEQQSAVNAIGK